MVNDFDSYHIIADVILESHEGNQQAALQHINDKIIAFNTSGNANDAELWVKIKHAFTLHHTDGTMV